MSESYQSSTYFYKIISLVIDIGTETLRTLFYTEVPKNSVATTFSASHIQQVFNKLKAKRVLTQDQFDKLKTVHDPETYDISLLLVLLGTKKVCAGIRGPAAGWGSEPSDSDLSLGADLLRLRKLRNSIVGHRHSAHFEKTEFETLWVQISDILLRIAGHVSLAEKAKTQKKISDAKLQELLPLEEREKKLLDVFLQWYRQDAERYQLQLNDVQTSLKNLHLKIDRPVTGTSSISEETFSSLQSEVSSLVENLSSIAQENAVTQVQQSIQSMGRDLQNLQKTVEVLCKQFQDNQQRFQALSEAAISPAPGIQNKKKKITNPFAMSDKELQDISKQIGMEWDSLRIHLDLTESQCTALKKAFPDSLQERIYKMLKAWHDVVVQDPRENPRMLLAAACVNASDNFSLACKIVPREQLDEKAYAKPTTVERIQNIEFRRDGFSVASWTYEEIYSREEQRTISLRGTDSTSEGNLTVSTSSARLPSGVQVFQPGPSLNRQETSGGSGKELQSSGSSRPLDSSGQPFKKEHDNTLSQTMMEALTKQMESVGALISGGDIIGTVFRVGSKYIMTAFHVVQCIIDPHRSGMYDFSKLEDSDTWISFSASAVIPSRNFFLKKEVHYNAELDVAVLEVSNLQDLPIKVALSKDDVSVHDVSLVGYGNPKNATKKYLDPRCVVIHPNSERVMAVLAWLEKERLQFKSSLRVANVDPELVDLGYYGFENPSKILFDCYMEHGASGAPVLTNSNERSIQIIGMLTHGLPEFYFRLPDSAKRNFPYQCRFEVGVKMKNVYDWMKRDCHEIAMDAFS